MRWNWAVVYMAPWPFIEASCGCGFRVPQNQTTDSLTFANALETNFGGMKTIDTNTDWVRQEFNVTAQAGRGRYGKMFRPDNVAVSHGKGLQLRVGSQIISNSISSAEIDTSNLSMLWGSYRAGIKLTATPGTCAAFFWYFNDTQEIDMEFLSHEFDPVEGRFPLNLVVQSRESGQAGFDAHSTNTFETINLGFDPTADFHEYRFDYLPGRVSFYIDSHPVCEMTGGSIPSSAGHLILQHWSNGNDQWSGGPPTEDAIVTVSYVKAYYNSSETSHNLFAECHGSMDRVCVVPDMSAINASTGGPYLTLGQPARDEANTASHAISAAQVVLYLVISWLITFLIVAYS